MTPTLPRRAALALPLVLALPRRARAAPLSFPDALGRTITLPGPAQRIVISFNYEEFTAVAGPAGWDRVVEFNMWGRMTELADGVNVAAGLIPVGFHPMAPESVLAAPEFVFITGSSWAGSPNAVRAGYGVDITTTRRTLAPYAARPGWAQLPAIEAGNLYAIETGLSRSLWDWTGTEYIAKQLHPAAFADIDPVADLRRYHEQFLPVAFDGTWMARLTPEPA